ILAMMPIDNKGNEKDKEALLKSSIDKGEVPIFVQRPDELNYSSDSLFFDCGLYILEDCGNIDLSMLFLEESINHSTIPDLGPILPEITTISPPQPQQPESNPLLLLCTIPTVINTTIKTEIPTYQSIQGQSSDRSNGTQQQSSNSVVQRTKERRKNLPLELQTITSRSPLREWIAFGRMALIRFEFQTAETILRRAVILEPRSPDAWRWLGHTYYCQNRYEDAQHCFQSALILPGGGTNDGSLLLRLGYIFYTNFDLRQSVECFLRSAAVAPQCAAYLGAGVSLMRSNLSRFAEQCFSEANFLDPYNADCWGYLCLFCLQTEREDEAQTSFEQALRCNLENSELLGEIASQFQLNSQLRQAELACRTAISAADQNHAKQSEIEKKKIQQEEDERGIQKKQDITTSGKQETLDTITVPRVRRVLGDVLFAQTDYEGALKYYNEALSVLSQTPNEDQNDIAEREHTLRQKQLCEEKIGK
ncbi:MAG: putative Tetratricopeptide repeat protein 18, partial [Streblomastix strix]